ncbi:hypothetical protein EJ110_NYTH19410 [Nymphaea thermarum]|nr:hypothetical protein EJ110_NYTH19410 [Nymphaea thermarum]
MASTGGSSSYASASLNPASSIQWNAFASLVSVKLDRTNFLMWRSQIKAVMISQHLIKYVDGTCEAPARTTIGEGNITTENLAYVMWKRSDQLALSWILATVSEPVLGQNHTAKTCYDIPKAFAAMAIQSMNDNSWYADSGASHHIAADDTNLNKTNEYTGIDGVVVGNGSQLAIAGLQDREDIGDLPECNKAGVSFNEWPRNGIHNKAGVSFNVRPTYRGQGGKSHPKGANNISAHARRTARFLGRAAHALTCAQARAHWQHQGTVTPGFVATSPMSPSHTSQETRQNGRIRIAPEPEIRAAFRPKIEFAKEHGIGLLRWRSPALLRQSPW